MMTDDGWMMTDDGWCIVPLSPRSTYPQLVPEGVLANVLALLLLVYGVLVGYIVTREEFRRPPNPEEEALSVHFSSLTPTSP